MQDSSSEVCMMIVMALVALFNLPSLFFNELSWAFTSRGILVCLGLGLVTASMAFALFFGGTKTTPAAVASTLGMAEPLGAALWGITLLHEPCSHNPLRNCADFVVSYSFDQTRETNCLLHSIACDRFESCEINISNQESVILFV